MPNFKRYNNFYDYSIGPVLEANIKNWLDYGFLEIGAYTCVKLTGNTSGLSSLKRTYDASYGGTGRVYEGFGPSWIWETDVSTPSGYEELFRPSGVFINNTFFAPSTSGAFGHKIDYVNGRVIFNSSIPASSGVKCEYCFRDVEVYLSDDPKWMRSVSNYRERFDTIGTFNPSGLASILKENRLWPNCVIVDVNSRNKARGLQLGGGQIVEYNISYNVFANEAFMANSITDTIADQQEKILKIYDVNEAPRTFNYDGTLASGAITYPELSDKNGPYFATFARIDGCRVLTKEQGYNFYHNQIYHKLEVDRYLLY